MLDIGLHELSFPVQGEELLDAEFADDMRPTSRNSSKPWSIFLSASVALINWHKSCGFWSLSSPIPVQQPRSALSSILEGTIVRYLEYQVGFDITPEHQIAPLLSIKKKFLFWSSARLSLAGPVLVAN